MKGAHAAYSRTCHHLLLGEGGFRFFGGCRKIEILVRSAVCSLFWLHKKTFHTIDEDAKWHLSWSEPPFRDKRWLASIFLSLSCQHETNFVHVSTLGSKRVTGDPIKGSLRGNQNEKSGGAVIDSRAKFAWKLGSCRNYRRAINQRIMSQTRTRVVQTCPSFLDSCAGIFQSFPRMDKTIFHAVLYNNKAQVFTKPIIFAAMAGFQNNTQSSRPKPLC